jgi:hypothetical protein
MDNLEVDTIMHVPAWLTEMEDLLGFKRFRATLVTLNNLNPERYYSPEEVSVRADVNYVAHASSRLNWAFHLCFLEVYKERLLERYGLKYENVQSFLTIYPEFSNVSPVEQRNLWLEANWMNIYLWHFGKRFYRKGLMVGVIPKFIEGVDVKYVTGGGQKHSTSMRALIFEREGEIRRREFKKERAQFRRHMKARAKSQGKVWIAGHGAMDVTDDEQYFDDVDDEDREAIWNGADEKEVLLRGHNIAPPALVAAAEVSAPAPAPPAPASVLASVPATATAAAAGGEGGNDDNNDDDDIQSVSDSGLPLPLDHASNSEGNPGYTNTIIEAGGETNPGVRGSEMGIPAGASAGAVASVSASLPLMGDQELSERALTARLSICNSKAGRKRRRDTATANNTFGLPGVPAAATTTTAAAAAAASSKAQDTVSMSSLAEAMGIAKFIFSSLLEQTVIRE